MPEERTPLEFKIDGNDIFFKEGAMLSFSHFGRLYTAVPTEEENKYEIKKFNLESGQYEHSNELTEFYIFDQLVEVTDGYLTAIPPEPEPIPEEEPQPSNSELLQKLQEQETTNLNRDEMMLEQQLMLLDIQLNVGA